MRRQSSSPVAPGISQVADHDVGRARLERSQAWVPSLTVSHWWPGPTIDVSAMTHESRSSSARRMICLLPLPPLGDREPEVASLSPPAGDAAVAAHQRGKPPADGQRLEDLAWLHVAARAGHLEADQAVLALGRGLGDAHHDLAGAGEGEGVPDQVDQDLAHPGTVAFDQIRDGAVDGRDELERPLVRAAPASSDTTSSTTDRGSKSVCSTSSARPRPSTDRGCR